MNIEYKSPTLARCEARLDEMEDSSITNIRKYYEYYAEHNDEEMCAMYARKLRNALLNESDKECAFDRIIPDMPSGNSFTDWLAFLKRLAGIKMGEWGKYRQLLRDLPLQEGFPFNIVFPEKPKGEEE